MTTATQSTALYQPLDRDRRQIRLARLTTADAQGIHCIVETFEFEYAPEYDALSYEWGSPDVMRTITINGQSHHIRSNLYEFLVVFKQRSSLRWIWIDQLVINQQNTEERNHQVQLMAEIYSKATEVLIWLGPAQDSDDWAIDYIANPQYNGYIENALYQKYTRQSLMNSMPQEALMPPPEPLFSGICSFIEKPYWKRLWVVQEVFIAKSRIILCGDHQLSWKAFHAFTYLLGHPQACNDAFELCIEASEGKLENLDTVVRRYSKKKCEDGRDKIYGVQALVRPGQRIYVDYSKSARQLLVDVIVNALDAPFGRSADLRQRSYFCHKCRFGEFEIILPAMVMAVDRTASSRVPDHNSLPGSATELASRMGVTFDDHFVLHHIIHELEMIKRSDHPVSHIWGGQWAEYMLDDVLMHTGEKWRIWKETFQYQQEALRNVVVTRVEYAEYVQLYSFEAYRRWRYRHGPPSSTR